MSRRMLGTTRPRGGTHSARIGSASEAVKNPSVFFFDLKRAGHWQSNSAPGGYLRDNEESLKKIPELLGFSMLEENKKQILKALAISSCELRPDLKINTDSTNIPQNIAVI